MLLSLFVDRGGVGGIDTFVKSHPMYRIMGTGWASMNLLRNLDEGTLKEYSIMVVSPASRLIPAI